MHHVACNYLLRKIFFTVILLCSPLHALAQIEATPEIGALGNFHAVGFLRDDGTLWSWGDNNSGDLADDTGIDSDVPVEALISEVIDISDCSSGSCINAAVKADGTVWTWGAGAGTLAGDNAQANYFAPIQLAGISDAVAVSTGSARGMAILADGRVIAWGGTSGWDRGLSGSVVYPPTEVPGLSGVIDIALGRGWGAALRSDGTVWTWGDNENGVLGRSIAQSSNNPPGMVEGLTDIVQIAAGDSHILALGADGRVWGWGRNGDGQVGDGSKAARSEPRELTSLSNVSFIQVAFNSSFAILADGTVYGWGNWSNACCDPPLYSQPDPYEVPDIPPMITIGALSVGSKGGSIGLSANCELWRIGFQSEQIFEEFDCGRIPSEIIPSVCQSYFFSNGKLSMSCVDTSEAGLEPPVYSVTMNPVVNLDFALASAEPVTLPGITPLRECLPTYSVSNGLIAPCLTAFVPGYGPKEPYEVGFELLPEPVPSFRVATVESASIYPEDDPDDPPSSGEGFVVGDDPLDITGTWQFEITNINLPLVDACANHPVTETENVVISYNPNLDRYRFVGDGANFDGAGEVVVAGGVALQFTGTVPYDNGTRGYSGQAGVVGGQIFTGSVQWGYSENGVTQCQGNWQIAFTSLD